MRYGGERQGGGKNILKKYFGEKKKAVTFALPIGREGVPGWGDGTGAMPGKVKEKSRKYRRGDPMDTAEAEA
ncbi:hypothetical protein [Olivibacter jilunii]|uniref:hypothetical protein n=1 Tax=Olivibacter jilunii TaxID=985016 RepID=UPI003F16F223